MKITSIEKQRLRHAAQTPGAGFKNMAGLGLLEVMLFLFVVGSLLVVGYAWLAVKKQADVAQTRTVQLQLISRYIETFATVNYRLPCPALTQGGVENCSDPANVKGFLPFASIGLNATDAKVGGSEIRYMVSRSTTVDLGTAANSYEPEKLKTGDTYSFGQISTGDYCRSLRNSGKETTGVMVVNGAAGRRVAYAIAHPGQVNADGVGSNFDGRNDDVGNQMMEAPEVGQSGGDYDDQVLARSAEELMFNADCAGHLIALNMLGLGVNVIDEVKAQFKAAEKDAEDEIEMAIFTTAVSAYAIGTAGLSLGSSIIELAAFSAALSAAIAGCIVLVTCALIPPFSIGVTLQSVAIGLNALAVAAAIAALVINIIYIGLVREVKALARSAGTQGPPDLRTEIDKAYDRFKLAEEKEGEAFAKIAIAERRVSDLLPEVTNASNTLYGTTGRTIQAANTYSRPVGTVPTTDNNRFVDDVITKYDLLLRAIDDKQVADQGVKTAEQSAEVPPTADQAREIANARVVASYAQYIFDTAQTSYDAARAALISANYRNYYGVPPILLSIGPLGNYFIDNTGFIVDELNAYLDKYQQYYIAQKGVEKANNNYLKAQEATRRALAAYNRLAAVVTSGGPATGTPPTLFVDPEVILKIVEAKGGVN